MGLLNKITLYLFFIAENVHLLALGKECLKKFSI